MAKSVYELIQVSESSYYIQCPAKIGVIRTGGDEVCLIDSGSDRDAGKKVKKILDSRGWRLRAIYNTHSHADHIGGNVYLQAQTGCSIYAPGIERCFTRHPVLEPAFLYGGCPPKELRHKFLMAQPSDAQPLTEDVLPPGMRAIPLPGHSWDMVGFRTGDDVVYLADCLSSESTLEKYRISYLTDVAAYLAALEAAAAMKARLFIPAHAEAAEDIAPLARKNIGNVHEIADRIVGLCGEPIAFDSLLKRLFDAYGFSMTFEQYALAGSTVRSYLTWLTEQGRVRAGFAENALKWSAV